jgi:hypothetical protein
VAPISPRVNAADDLAQKTDERHAKTGFSTILAFQSQKNEISFTITAGLALWLCCGRGCLAILRSGSLRGDRA